MTTHKFPGPGDEEELRNKIAVGSKNYEDYTNLAYLCLAQGRYEDARSLYQQALGLPLMELERATVSIDFGGWLHEIGESAQAEVLAQNTITLLSDQPAIPKVLLYRGESYALLADCLSSVDSKASIETAEDALQCLQRVIAEAPGCDEIAQAYYTSAYLYLLNEDTGKAISLCEKCLQCQLGEIDRFNCLFVLSDGLLREKRFTEAERVIDEVLRFANAAQAVVIGCYFRRGMLQRSTGRLAEAIETFQQVLTRMKADSALQNNSRILGDIYSNMGATYHDLGKYSEAVAALQEVLARHPNNDDPYHVNALLWLGVGVPVKAQDYFQQVLASPHTSDVDKADAREALAHLDYEAGKYKEAAAVFQQVLAHCTNDDPRRSNTLLWLGHCYYETEASAKARDCFEQVLASPHTSDDKKADARTDLARLDYKLGKYQQAASAFHQLLTYYGNDDPCRPNLLCWLGSCYEKMVANDKARECFQQMLVLPHASENDKAWARKGLSRLPPSKPPMYH